MSIYRLIGKLSGGWANDTTSDIISSSDITGLYCFGVLYNREYVEGLSVYMLKKNFPFPSGFTRGLSASLDVLKWYFNQEMLTSAKRCWAPDIDCLTHDRTCWSIWKLSPYVMDTYRFNAAILRRWTRTLSHLADWPNIVLHLRPYQDLYIALYVIRSRTYIIYM